MATTQSKPNPLTDSVDSAAERVAELNEKAAKRVAELNEKAVERATEYNEQAVANSKKAGAAYLASVEKAWLSFADTYEKAAGATNVEWFANVATVQADLTRELTKAYTSATRELVA